MKVHQQLDFGQKYHKGTSVGVYFDARMSPHLAGHSDNLLCQNVCKHQ